MRVFFTGTYEYTIDGKGRLAIPAEIRAQITHSSLGNPAGPQFLHVTLGPKNNLCLYTDVEFQRLAESLDKSSMDPDELEQFEDMFFGSARRVEIDSQGRILIPDQLLIDTGLNKGKVALVGKRDHMEIHNLEAWQNHRKKVLETNPGVLNTRRVLQMAEESGSAGAKAQA